MFDLRDRTAERSYLTKSVSYAIECENDTHTHTHTHIPDADKSLALPTSRCRRAEPIVSLEANQLLRSNNICLLPALKNL